MDPSIDNALAPLEFILRVAGGLLLLVLLGTGAAALFGPSMTGGGDGVCVHAPVRAMTATTGERLHRVHSGGSNVLKPAVEATATTVELCDTSPSRTQHAWSALARFAPLGYAGGFIVCAWLVARSARRHGLFSPHVALGTGRLGLYVLLGAATVSLLRMWADNQLMLSMATTNTSQSWLFFFHYSWGILFAGFGLLTVGRVMARAVRMQREIDATV